MARRTSISIALIALALGPGCQGALSGTEDVGVDARGVDAPRIDAPVADVSELDVPGDLDTGASDVGMDAPADAGIDAPIDAGVDAPADAGVDAFVPDAGPYRASDRHTPRAVGYLDAPQGFWEYLPPSYSESGPGSPLLIFFHGLGENGGGSVDALASVLRNGPPREIDRDAWPRDRPFVVLSPQQGSGCPSAGSIAAFLAWARASYHLDETRLYLTGLSCGCIGIANYLAANVDTSDVAAVVGISGDWRNAWGSQMCDLGRMPIWALHGDADRNGGTLPDFSRLPITSLIECAAPPREEAILTMLPGVGHDGRAWNDTYSGANGHDVYAFLLRHTRP